LADITELSTAYAVIEPDLRNVCRSRSLLEIQRSSWTRSWYTSCRMLAKSPLLAAPFTPSASQHVQGGTKNRTVFKRLQLLCTMTQKDDTVHFLSAVSLPCCILPYLIMLCTSSVQQYYIKNNNELSNAVQSMYVFIKNSQSTSNCQHLPVKTEFIMSVSLCFCANITSISLFSSFL